MRKILIFKFPYSSLFGGGERHTLLLVENLTPKGFDFYLSSSCPVLLKEFRRRHWPARRAWAGLEPVSKVALLLWPLTAPLVAVNLSLKLLYYRIFKKVTLLYCLSLTEKILATPIARLLGMKVIWAEHVTVERWLTKNPLKIFYRLFSRQATVVAVSRAVKKQLTREIGVREENLTLIYSGVDLKKFAPRPPTRPEAARYNIGCIARIDKEKGIEFLIQSIKLIKEFIPFVRLIIVGDGPERKKLVWLSERLGLKENIQWVGYQREIEKWYSYFDAYALPSVRRESFGITLVEAMASGVPVAAARLGGIPEIVEHGRTGRLFTPGHSGEIADQLIYLYNNRSEARAMAAAARQKVEKQFSLERMTRDFYLLFRK